MESGGYDAEFVNPVPDHYKCSICLMVLRDPVQLRCGHQFCQICFHIAVKMRSKPCPLDNTEVELDLVFPDVALRRLTLDLKVQCKYNQDGCEWIGELRHLECHNEICGKFLLECTNKCGLTNIAREKLPSHIVDDCPLTQIECSYHCVGCNFKNKRCEMKNHKKNMVDQHLAMSLSLIANQQNQVTTQHDRITSLENQVTTLETGVKLLKNQLETQTQTQKQEIEQLKMTIIELNKKLDLEPTTKLQSTTQKNEKANIFEYNWVMQDVRTKYKCNEIVYSESFYTSMGYRVRLMFGRSFDDDILISVQVIKGEHDNNLLWPFLNIYKFTVMDPSLRNDHLSEISYPKKQCTDDIQQKLFGKPRKEYNDRHGWYDLCISKEKLFNGKYNKNNKIIIKYQVSTNNMDDPF